MVKEEQDRQARCEEAKGQSLATLSLFIAWMFYTRVHDVDCLYCR